MVRAWQHRIRNAPGPSVASSLGKEGVIVLEQCWRDLCYASRGLRQSRAFVATTVLTLAVGMGLVTVVFAVFNAYVLRPFAVHDP